MVPTATLPVTCSHNLPPDPSDLCGSLQDLAAAAARLFDEATEASEWDDGLADDIARQCVLLMTSFEDLRLTFGLPGNECPSRERPIIGVGQSSQRM